MKDLQKGILQWKECRKKYWMLDISGQLCTWTCMITADLVMHVKKQEDLQLKVLQSWSQVFQRNHL
jgi:hypothetical protein